MAGTNTRIGVDWKSPISDRILAEWETLLARPKSREGMIRGSQAFLIEVCIIAHAGVGSSEATIGILLLWRKRVGAVD